MLLGEGRDHYRGHADAVAVEGGRQEGRGYAVVVRSDGFGRSYVVEVAAVLVVGKEESGRGPAGAVEEGGESRGYEILANLHVGRWVFVILDVPRGEEDRVDEGHLGQSVIQGVREVV